MLLLYLNCFPFNGREREGLYLIMGWSGRSHQAVDLPFDPEERLVFMDQDPRGEQEGHRVRNHFNKREMDSSCFQRADTDEIPSAFISLLLPPS